MSALTPEELEAKGAEAEKRIAVMDDDELMDELFRGHPKPNVDDLIASGLLMDEAIKRRILAP